MSAQELNQSVDRLLGQVAHWQAARWAVRLDSGQSRADRVFALVQWLAEVGAQAEGRPVRPVPRIGALALPDQVRVMVRDLIAAAPPESVLAAARAEVDLVRGAL